MSKQENEPDEPDEPSMALGERTMSYWKAMRAWNGKATKLSGSQMNDLLQKSLNHGKQHEKVYNLACNGINLIIKHGYKPKRVRARKRGNVTPLFEPEQKKQQAIGKE